MGYESAFLPLAPARPIATLGSEGDAHAPCSF
jgi:hypothetical protein